MEQMVALIAALYRWFEVNGELDAPELKIYDGNGSGTWYAQIRYPYWDKDTYVLAWLEEEDELRLENQRGENLYKIMTDNGFSEEDILKIRFAKGSIKYCKAIT